jgi:thiol-disulfide isomerase/thioredoxin
MKVNFLGALMLLCTCSFAQQPVLTDDLSTRTDTIVVRYGLSNHLDPVRYNKRIDQVRKDAYRRIRSDDAKETALRRLDVDYYLRGVLANYHTFHDFGASKKFTDAERKYVDSLIWSHADLNNEELYKRSATYREWIDKYLDELNNTKYKSGTVIRWAKGIMLPNSVVLNEIQNPFIRDYICYQNAGVYLKVTTDSVLAGKIYQDFNAAVTNAYYREEIQQEYDNYRRLHTANMPAPDFTYTTIEGKQLTLGSLRGKFVYIDLWATWCGPCKREIPFLLKLEDQYKGKKIAFISLSVDKQADAGKWRNYVIGNELTGYQVMADSDFKSGFIKKMNVASIPRFILIDPAGKVVDGDAKRPSDPALKKQVDQLLGIPVAPFALSRYARQTDFSGHWQLNTNKTHSGGSLQGSSALTVTKSDTALLIDRTNVNEEKQQKHYSQQFRLDGSSTQTTTSSGSLETDSIVNSPDIPALTLGMSTKKFNIDVSITETWTLDDGGKTLVVDRQVVVPGLGKVEVKGYYDKK